MTKQSIKEKALRILSHIKARELAAIVGVLTFFLCNIGAFAAKCENIRDEVLRLHVVANSDSDADQALKLAVRDALLTAGAAIFDGSVTAQEATEKITPQIPALTATAQETLRSLGSDSPVHVTIAEEYFDTRSYESFTLPAGKYMALRVVIGEGAGKNWWCVMFPPLCLPAAEPAETEEDLNIVFSDGERKIVSDSSKYEIRFKIVELYEKIASRFAN